MPKSIVFSFVIAAAGLLAFSSFWLFSYTQKRNSGYCFDERRYLSNAELRDTFKKAFVKGMDNFYKSAAEDEKQNLIHYQTLEDFEEHNKDCCTIFSDSKPPSIMSFEGDIVYFGYVQIRRYKNVNPSQTSISYSITPCGVVKTLRDVSTNSLFYRNGD